MRRIESMAVAAVAVAAIAAAGCAYESDIGLDDDAAADADTDTDTGWTDLVDLDTGVMDWPGDDPPITEPSDPVPDTASDPLPDGAGWDIPDVAQMFYAGHECYRHDHCLGVSYDAPVCLYVLDGHEMYNGYCSVLCTETTETSSCHGEHTDCLGMFADGNAYCMALCATDYDCRGPEYYCLEDPLDQGIMERFCVPSTWPG